MREAVDYLADLGHTVIARVSGFEGFSYTVIRDATFIKAMTARGLRPTVIRTNYSPDAGAQATRRALSSADPPSALIFDNDIMAVAALGVAAQLGLRVPGDLSLVAWDDSSLCGYVHPKLTALSHDVSALGAHAASRLLDVIGGTPPAAHQDVTPRLLVRASTGPHRC
ncbi:LacI family DNA-binding transcriptional regulator [Subtercola boreus]|uniref:LacI family DNA-binding transcriptional regulator n=1 Tax=Subtercola boreus TaxID=120213 RepID=UPI000E2A2CF4|nr:substrate-binding domain-containing protein [Subtercola boreus]